VVVVVLLLLLLLLLLHWPPLGHSAVPALARALKIITRTGR
jgi:hypothetical protein